MKQDEFCYWLQGFFEIHGGKPSIGRERLQIISNHLELVKKCKNKPIDGFCAWLEGALATAPTVDYKLIPEAVDVIQARLGDEFLHVIDPKVPGDKEELQAVHDGLQRPRPRPEKPRPKRC